MQIVVCVKQTADTAAKISIDSQGAISDGGGKKIINPNDEYAIEAGLQLREQFGGKVTVMSFGDASSSNALRTALGMGADEACLIRAEDGDSCDGYAIANALAATIEPLHPDIVIAGRASADDGAGQMAPRLAEALGFPLVYGAMNFEVADGKLTASRNAEGRNEVFEADMPVVVTAQKGMNEPRFASVAGLMKAKKKPFREVPLSEVDVDSALLEGTVAVVGRDLPQEWERVSLIDGDSAQAAFELIRRLHDEAKVI